MGAFIFACNIESQSKEAFQRRFKRSFLFVDILCIFYQFYDYWRFSGIVHFWILNEWIYLITGCMFAIDALLLIWLLTYKSNESIAPMWLLVVNWITNSITLVPYTIGRAMIIQIASVELDRRY